jgi:hypothetical protein
LVVEYYPSGFFEKTGNLWRAQGRRMRLDFKNFQRYVTLTQEEPEGWRGEIRDGEVVVSHEDALEEEEAEQADSEDSEDSEDEETEDEAEGAYADEDDDEAGAPDEDVDEDEDEDGAEDEVDGEYEDEEDADEEDADEEEDEDEEEDVTPSRKRRGQRRRRD